MSDTAIPSRQLQTLQAGSKKYSLQNHNSSVILAPDMEVLGDGQEPSIRWEILVQEIFEETRPGQQTATVNAWKGNLKVGQIDFDLRPNSWTITFHSDDNFTQIHAMATFNNPVAVVFRTRTETKVVLFDTTTNQFIGDNPDVGTCTFPAQDVANGLRPGIEALDALNHSDLVLFQESQGDAKARCESTRKSKIGAIVGVAVTAAVGILTGGASLLVQATLTVAGGMVAYGTGKAVNNEAEKCKLDAEKDHPE